MAAVMVVTSKSAAEHGQRDAGRDRYQAADVVRVLVATLRYWRHLGTGPRSFRIGRSVRYWRTEVAL
jgi:hypothetical protein